MAFYRYEPETSSSTDTHVDLLRRAIEAGLPTYCEKPIDKEVDRVKRVVAEAEEASLPVFVGFRRRFMPDLQMMHKKIRNGDLGRIDQEAVKVWNQYIRTREHLDEKRKSIFDYLGLPDDGNMISAVILNHLEDWEYAYRKLKSSTMYA